MPQNKFQKLLLKSFLFALVTSLIFTILDYLTHFFIPFLEITTYRFNYFSSFTPLNAYVIGKFIATTIILTILFILFNKVKFKSYYTKFSLIFIITIVLIYISGYLRNTEWILQNALLLMLLRKTGIKVGKMILYPK